ncbi:MAG: ribonuclease E activity regulator RraA [Pseudomonadota bacterium]
MSDHSAFSTPDLADAHTQARSIVLPWRSYGGVARFHGPVVTIKCFEDNSLIKELAGTAGEGRIMLVDGGQSPRRALLGDQIAANAAANGWAGLVIAGAVRDVEVLATIKLGVNALFAGPQKTEKRGEGQREIPIEIGGMAVHPGEYVYVDDNGVLVSDSALL